MRMVFASLYRALLAAGTPDDLARKAAEEVVRRERTIDGVLSNTAVLTWMVGSNLALTIAIGFKVLFFV